MKYIRQFGIIVVISLIGEVLNYVIPLPVPSSIYGLIIMFLCLHFKIVKIEDVKETSIFLIEIMPLMFIPAAVGIIDSWGVISPNIIKYGIITIISTVLVMAVSGRVTQWVINRKKGDKKG